MFKNLILLATCAVVQLSFSAGYSQTTFKYGFGGGANFANIMEINSYPLVEDISGAEYESNYSNMFTNIGTQFFFHGEFWLKNFIVAFKPGVHTYKFNKTDQVIFNQEVVVNENRYLNRYLQVPLEVKMVFGSGTLKPYLGGGIAYGHLLQQVASGTHSFISPKFTVAPLAGAYYSFDNFDLVLTGGYNFGLHTVTKKSDRYNVGSSTPYAQSDILLNDLYVTLSILFSVQKPDSRGTLDCPTPKKGKAKKEKKPTKYKK